MVSLTLKENTISNIFYNIHNIEITTQKGEHLWKCTELSLKRKEGKALTPFCFQYVDMQSAKRCTSVNSTYNINQKYTIPGKGKWSTCVYTFQYGMPLLQNVLLVILN